MVRSPRPAVPSRIALARVQPYLWFAGMLVFSTLNHITGLLGMPRRVFDASYGGEPITHTWQDWTGLSALGGSILYVLHHMLVISTLFLVSGLFLRQRRTTDLHALGGLYRAQPAVAALALIPLFSLAGIPPLSGFVAKVAVVAPMLGTGQYALAAVVLGVSLLTVLSMARLWAESIWKPSPVPAPASVPQARLGAAIVAPIAFLAALTVGLTVLAGPVASLTREAAAQLLDRNAYLRAVLGEEGQRAAR